MYNLVVLYLWLSPPNRIFIHRGIHFTLLQITFFKVNIYQLHFQILFKLFTISNRAKGYCVRCAILYILEFKTEKSTYYNYYLQRWKNNNLTNNRRLIRQSGFCWVWFKMLCLFYYFRYVRRAGEYAETASLLTHRLP